MRKIVFMTLCMTLMLSHLTFAQQRGFGLGVIVGEPTGFSMKYWMNDSRALDMAAAWSFGNYQAFQFHADYLFHHSRYLDRNSPLYYGIGGRLKISDHDRHSIDKQERFGLRFPLGFTHLFQEAPLDFFLEIVPILDLAPSTDFSFNAAVGMRFYF